uniref:Putative transposable element n=1 Tax=Rhipicephalus microplus TaxID=6941 RepID=A0A6M2CWH5_RHIMP
MSNHTDDPKASFLSAFITWLDVWEFYRHDTGVLTQETLSALRLSAQSLLALVKYCVSELHFKYILLGKVQTDPLESLFGQYRQMAGGQYHISVRQLCETEGRIRLQNALPRMSNDDLRGIEETDSVRDAGTSFSVHVSDADLDELRAQMPVIGYVGGYCAHAAMKVLKCESCQRQLVVTGNTAETGEDTHSLIAQLDRGGLKFTSALVIAVVMYTEVVVRKLMTESTSTQFLHGPNQKNVVRQLTLDSLPRLEDIDTCENGHT